MRVCMYLYMCVRMYIYMYEYLYIRIYTYMYTRIRIRPLDGTNIGAFQNAVWYILQI